MSKLGFALGILVLPCAFHSVKAQAAESKSGTATISGRVTLKGEPARGVMVILQTQYQGPSNAPRARTDESGRFYFAGLPAGRYSISAVAPGYVSPEDSMLLGMRGKTLNLTDGEKVENVDLEIKRGGVIAGRVTDSQGRPVIEESVSLSRIDANNQPRGVPYFTQNFEMYQTDDRGLYRVYGLPEGRYLVSVGYVENSGSARVTSRREFYPRVFYPNVTSESEAKVIEVGEGSEATNIDITVTDPKQTHDVSGRVVDAGSGQPVAGVELSIGGVTREGRYVGGGYGGGGARSGPNGEFRIFGVMPGKYALIVPPEESSGFVADPVIFDISEGDASGVELRVRKGASISGVAVIEGTNDPNVLSKLSQVNILAFIRPTGSNMASPMAGRRPFKVNADGSFRLEGLQDGKAMIMVLPPPEMRGLTLARIEHNGAPAPEGVEVNPGEQVTGVRLVLVHGTLSIRGEVKIVGAAFPAGQRFRASARRVDQPMQNPVGGDVDARGQFVIENLAPGEYEVGVGAFFMGDGQQLSPEIRRLISSVKERVVLSGGNQQSVTLVIDLSRKEGDR